MQGCEGMCGKMEDACFLREYCLNRRTGNLPDAAELVQTFTTLGQHCPKAGQLAEEFGEALMDSQRALEELRNLPYNPYEEGQSPVS